MAGQQTDILNAESTSINTTEANEAGLDKPEINLDVLSEEAITEAVHEINRMVGDSLYKTAIEVGNYVLKIFFDNDIGEASLRSPNKAVSLRKLQNHPDLKIHFNTLNQMVRVAAQEKHLLAALGETDVDKLSYSHRIELLRFDDDQKIDIAKKCIIDNLSVRDMREISNTQKESKSSEDSQNAKMLPVNAILKKIIAQYSDDKVTDETFQKLSFLKIDTMKSKIDKFIGQIDDVKNKLSKIKGMIDPVYLKKKDEEENPTEKKRGRPAKTAE